MKRPLLILSTLLALAGCTGTYSEPTLPADHPANATATEGPAVTTSRTLELAASEPAAPTPTSPGMESRPHTHDAPSPPAGAKPEVGAAATALYVCPMHPEVTSDKPDQHCPKCGMKLVKQNGGTQP